jgi:hypothetical protein
MLTIEIRIQDDEVKVRPFGSAKQGWQVVRPGESDRISGWFCEKLRGLGEGVWQFAERRREEAVEV